MIRRIIVVGLFLLLLALVSNQSAPPVTAQSPAYEVIQLVNDFRAANGLPALQINGSLMIAAQQQADYMAATGIYSHTGYNGSSPQSRAESAGYVGWVSENIVGGTNLTPQKGLIWWQNSAVHYAALVSTRYTEVGAGYSSGFDQNFYTLVVGRPSDAPPSAAAPAAANNQPQPLQVAPFVAATPAEDGSIVHVVQQGQALWTLAAHYEVPLQDILLYNGLSEDSMVNPGDEVIIRLGEGQAPPPTPTPPTTHIVREGQTLWYIANVYQVELTDLLWFNGLSGDAVLQPGQELTIRLAEGQAPPLHPHHS
ncbi:MAG: LysM peptidoglycan-binding domain-containing protein [Candidatus Promineifilaceae bacterium]